MLCGKVSSREHDKGDVTVSYRLFLAGLNQNSEVKKDVNVSIKLSLKGTVEEEDLFF